jgi:N-acyl-D-aspartate/D-glutamate deacylase
MPKDSVEDQGCVDPNETSEAGLGARTLNRREFLKGAAVVGAAVAFGGLAEAGNAAAASKGKKAVGSYATRVLFNGEVHTMDPRNPRVSAIAMKGDKIIAVGSLRSLDGYIKRGVTRVRNVDGLVIAPGFVDMHFHDFGGDKEAVLNLRQGVTTTVTGNCGQSETTIHEIDGASHTTGVDIGAFVASAKATGFPHSMATFVGANSLRHAVGITDAYTAATAAQIQQMIPLAEKAMKDGAVGISFGTEYEPGQSYDEILALARVAAKYNRLIASHVRTGTPKPPITVVDSINEVIKAGRESGCPAVHISHIGSMAAKMMPASFAAMDAAREQGMDITCDCYPYNHWSTSLKSAIFDPGWQDLFDVTYSDILICSGPYSGQTCDAALFDQLRAAAEDTVVAVYGIPEPDVVYAYQRHYCAVISDSYAYYDTKLNSWAGHPRGAGSFVRALGKYVREDGVMSLDQALYKMTALPAWRLGMTTKGMLRAGRDADVVVFDKNRVKDTAWFSPGTNANAPVGVELVYVRGQLACLGTEYTGTMSGRVLTPKQPARGHSNPMPQMSRGA